MSRLQPGATLPPPRSTRLEPFRWGMITWEGAQSPFPSPFIVWAGAARKRGGDPCGRPGAGRDWNFVHEERTKPMATLYLSEQQSIVKKRDEYLVVQYPGPEKRKIEVPLIKISQVVVSGDVTLTTPALHTLLEAGIEVCFLSMYGQ